MQKKIIALAVAGLASTAAFAQTNVTIYGVADVGYNHYSGAGRHGQNSIESGNLAGSRLGFKGTEDLGNGLKAVFTLEYALAIDDNTGIGQADRAGTAVNGLNNTLSYNNASASGTASRQAFVGLSSASLGTLVLGRLSTAGYDWACAYSPTAGAAFDTVGKLGVNTILTCGTGGRRDNAAAYISPTFGGLTVAVNTARVTENRNLLGSSSTFTSAAASTTPGAPVVGALLGSTGNQINRDAVAYIAHVKYENGPLNVGAIWSKIYDSAQSNNPDDVREYGIGATYDFKVVKLFASYQNQKASSVYASTVAGVAPTDGSDSKWLLGASAPFGKSVVMGSVAKATRHDASSNGATTNPSNDRNWAWNATYLYNMSKRTTLYAGYTRLVNDAETPAAANSAGFNGLGNPATTTLGGASNILSTGVRHMF